MALDTQELLDQLDLAPTDGVMLIVFGPGSLDVHIPQLGMLTEARLEVFLPHIYRAIMAKRATLLKEAANERNAKENRTKPAGRAKH